MKLSKLCGTFAVLALASVVAGCGSNTAEQADTTATVEKNVVSTYEVTTKQESPAETKEDEAEPSSSEENSSDNNSDGEAASGSTELKHPEKTELTFKTKWPEKVGKYTGKAYEVGGFGPSFGKSVQIEYSDHKNYRDMSLVATALEFDEMVKSFKGTNKPLGKIGECGLLYGNKGTPICMLRVEGNHTLSVGGDYKASIDEVRTFTIQLLNLIKEQ